MRILEEYDILKENSSTLRNIESGIIVFSSHIARSVIISSEKKSIAIFAMRILWNELSSIQLIKDQNCIKK
ncbi:hypothetical protein LCGC14_2282220 [marine sediment metagenome]|uniref:Uncharacterized protein n=1 Tax=marine sediment metagenome TaxID=412755 RepID=A0A0F9CTQ2_9ZZZZ